MRATSSRRAQLAALLALLAAAPAAADGDRVAATKLPTCTDGEPFLAYIVDATADDDCDSTGGGTTEAPCLCLDGAYVAMLAGGGAAGDSFKTQNTPSGTDPVADSSTDTLNWTAGTGITLTGDSTTDTITVASTIPSITLDLGDDAGNDSTALAEIATLNDNGGAFTESSADKLSIDVAKLRPASFDNPPASPHAYDDEFNAGTLDSKWTIGSSGTTNPATSGAIDYTASLTTPIVDAATIAGHVAFQSDNSSGATFWIRQAYSAATDSTFMVKIGALNRNVSTNGEGQVIVRLTNSADSNEAIGFGVNHTGGSVLAAAYAINNGSVTTLNSGSYSETAPLAAWYVVCWKKSDVYHLAVAASTGALDYVGSVTKTGVTTLDQLQIEMTTANETPSVVNSVDFFRYKASLDYGLVNE